MHVFWDLRFPVIQSFLRHWKFHKTVICQNLNKLIIIIVLIPPTSSEYKQKVTKLLRAREIERNLIESTSHQSRQVVEHNHQRIWSYFFSRLILVALQKCDSNLDKKFHSSRNFTQIPLQSHCEFTSNFLCLASGQIRPHFANFIHLMTIYIPSNYLLRTCGGL